VLLKLLFIIVALGMVAWAVSACVLMVTVGNVHAWWPHIPTMSFGAALSISFPSLLIGIVLGLFSRD
jgi:hypothetical protein